MSSFFGLNVALTALQANQYAMDVTGHNIANANTEGYRRQEAMFTANLPYTNNMNGSATTLSQLGTGVVVTDIRRTQTDYLDTQVRNENQQVGMWGTKSQALQQIEPLFQEPSDAGLGATLNAFWNSWTNLAASPDDISARTTVVAASNGLADQMKSIHDSLSDMQKNLDQEVTNKVTDINTLVTEIASINNQTVQGASGQYQPNDLIDKRDLLIEQLSKIIKIEVHGTAGANMSISIGGHALVQGNWHTTVNAMPDANDRTKLVWADDNSNVAVNGGDIAGLTDVRDNTIGGYLSTLDSMATTIVDHVNDLHILGYDGYGNGAWAFFQPCSSAADMQLDSLVQGDPERIAAASESGSASSNEIANMIADLKSQPLINGQKIGDVYSGMIAKVGTDAKEASVHNDAHQATLEQRKTQRESVAGVSMDEEMSNMVKFQQSYNAAARIFKAVDEMLQTIISAV